MPTALVRPTFRSRPVQMSPIFSRPTFRLFLAICRTTLSSTSSFSKLASFSNIILAVCVFHSRQAILKSLSGVHNGPQERVMCRFQRKFRKRENIVFLIKQRDYKNVQLFDVSYPECGTPEAVIQKSLENH